jgi:hypothetical protein
MGLDSPWSGHGDAIRRSRRHHPARAGNGCRLAARCGGRDLDQLTKSGETGGGPTGWRSRGGTRRPVRPGPNARVGLVIEDEEPVRDVGRGARGAGQAYSAMTPAGPRRSKGASTSLRRSGPSSALWSCHIARSVKRVSPRTRVVLITGGHLRSRASPRAWVDLMLVKPFRAERPFGREGCAPLHNHRGCAAPPVTAAPVLTLAALCDVPPKVAERHQVSEGDGDECGVGDATGSSPWASRFLLSPPDSGRCSGASLRRTFRRGFALSDAFPREPDCAGTAGARTVVTPNRSAQLDREGVVAILSGI